jgi:Flp pilus assembly protein TadD
MKPYPYRVSGAGRRYNNRRGPPGEGSRRDGVTRHETQALRSLGDAHVRAGRIDEAQGAYRAAVALSPDDGDAWRGLARALEALHDAPGASEAWQRVATLSPDDWAAKNDLGAWLMERRDWEGAERALASASALAPAEPMVTLNRSTLLVRTGRVPDGVALARSCVEQNPALLSAHLALGFALRELGALDEAVTALRRAVAMAPGNAAAACGLSRALLEHGAAAEASAVAQASLARNPGHAGSLAAESLARLALGDTVGANRLLDHERFVARLELGAPEGYPDLPSFNRALAAHVEHHPTLVASPASHATAGGLHSGSLLVSPRGPVALLERSLRNAIAHYSRTLPDLRDHPFTTHRPRAAFLNVWGVVLERGGHQTPHIHPSAWLSGVYYAKVPAAIAAGDGPAGWLEFGGADRSFPSASEPHVVRTRPTEGTLVLFPSYFHHRTIPFDADGTRVSIAFDLVPSRT